MSLMKFFIASPHSTIRGCHVTSPPLIPYILVMQFKLVNHLRFIICIKIMTMKLWERETLSFVLFCESLIFAIMVCLIGRFQHLETLIYLYSYLWKHGKHASFNRILNTKVMLGSDIEKWFGWWNTEEILNVHVDEDKYSASNPILLGHCLHTQNTKMLWLAEYCREDERL